MTAGSGVERALRGFALTGYAPQHEGRWSVPRRGRRGMHGLQEPHYEVLAAVLRENAAFKRASSRGAPLGASKDEAGGGVASDRDSTIPLAKLEVPAQRKAPA
ncbi:hypothetical protein AMC83_CH03073 [Rhizobium phaseoli]|nr:hypothetical protein AMC83_CH03073 [Rhizobium phaseoli]